MTSAATATAPAAVAMTRGGRLDAQRAELAETLAALERERAELWGDRRGGGGGGGASASTSAAITPDKRGRRIDFSSFSSSPATPATDATGDTWSSRSMEVDGGASGERAAAAAAASRIRELESQVESLTERAESAERREKGAYSEIERALEENLELIEGIEKARADRESDREALTASHARALRAEREALLAEAARVERAANEAKYRAEARARSEASRSAAVVTELESRNAALVAALADGARAESELSAQFDALESEHERSRSDVRDLTEQVGRLTDLLELEASTPAPAQTPDDDLRAEMRREVEAEHAARVESLVAVVAEMRGELDDLKAGSDAARAETRRLRSERDSHAARLSEVSMLLAASTGRESGLIVELAECSMALEDAKDGELPREAPTPAADAAADAAAPAAAAAAAATPAPEELHDALLLAEDREFLQSSYGSEVGSVLRECAVRIRDLTSELEAVKAAGTEAERALVLERDCLERDFSILERQYVELSEILEGERMLRRDAPGTASAEAAPLSPLSPSESPNGVGKQAKPPVSPRIMSIFEKNNRMFLSKIAEGGKDDRAPGAN